MNFWAESALALPFLFYPSCNPHNANIGNYTAFQPVIVPFIHPFGNILLEAIRSLPYTLI